MEELKKQLSMHGRPGHPSYDEKSKSPLTNSKAATAGVVGQAGHFANVFVPDDVTPGDTLELRAGGRKVRVIVDHVDQSKADERNPLDR